MKRIELANQVLQATAGLRSGFTSHALGRAAPEHYRSPKKRAGVAPVEEAM